MLPTAKTSWPGEAGEEENKKKEEEEEPDGCYKSNNPHLAGGKKAPGTKNFQKSPLRAKARKVPKKSGIGLA